MYVRENPVLAKRVLQEALGRVNARPRAQGLHVSDLIYCLKKAWYRRNGVAPDMGTDDDSEAESILALGHGHHAVLQPPAGSEMGFAFLLPSGEQVFGTIDVYWPQSDLWQWPTEIKSTRYSSNKDAVYGTPHYLEQLASYLLAMRETRGQLLVWHLLGDYKEHRSPKLKAYDVFFEQSEMDSWRLELERRADVVLSSQEPDVFGENHYDWECKYCEWHVKKGGPCAGGPGRIAPFFFPANPPAWLGGLDRVDSGDSLVEGVD